MAYTINLTDGTIFATIADGTINTSSSMILVGKNYAGYGEFLDENFIHLLESGSNTTPPGAPLVGQLWWDKTNSVMKVYNGTTFKVISAATASASQPTSNVAGDLWFDTVNGQLKVYNGTSFILVGPASTSGQGTSGAIVTTVVDTLSVQHVIVQLFVNNVIVGIVSKDATFTPSPAISGFGTIGPGIQLSTTVSNALFRGTVTNAQTLDGFNPADFLSAIANDTTSGTLGILNDTGLTVGADQDAKISVTTATSAVNIQNQTQDANINIIVNDGGTPTTVMSVNGATAQVSFPTTVAITGNISIGNLTATGTVAGNIVSAGSITKTGSNAVGNIGSASNYFNQVFATATTALYADVAERFAADEIMLPGTVVELGGSAEITTASGELSENVFGVISTRAAYLMNGGAGTDETHPPVAMTGRVPVRVVGTVRKGDRLVSAGNGLARAANPGEATWNNTIGRALEDRIGSDEGTVEAIVTIK
jgi:hypothetical protein